MSLSDVCLRITEDASGASGPAAMDRGARLDNAAEALGDWVYEYYLDDGVSLDAEGFAYVRRLVAAAMIAQHDYDADLWGGVMDDLRELQAKAG